MKLLPSSQGTLPSPGAWVLKVTKQGACEHLATISFFTLPFKSPLDFLGQLFQSCLVNYNATNHNPTIKPAMKCG